MAIPKFHQTFLPILKILKDEKVYISSDLPDLLISNDFFKLSDDELAEEQSKWGKCLS